jgi:uncharacterized protein YndB with AHSA1/START domain
VTASTAGVRPWCISPFVWTVPPRRRAVIDANGGGGRYTEIEPPNRLAFTWIWDGDDTRQLIELDFDEDDGVTTVRFTHSGLWDEEAVRSHEGGWGKAFDNLERALAA